MLSGTDWSTTGHAQWHLLVNNRPSCSVALTGQQQAMLSGTYWSTTGHAQWHLLVNNRPCSVALTDQQQAMLSGTYWSTTGHHAQWHLLVNNRPCSVALTGQQQAMLSGTYWSTTGHAQWHLLVNNRPSCSVALTGQQQAMLSGTYWSTTGHAQWHLLVNNRPCSVALTGISRNTSEYTQVNHCGILYFTRRCQFWSCVCRYPGVTVHIEQVLCEQPKEHVCVSWEQPGICLLSQVSWFVFNYEIITLTVPPLFNFHSTWIKLMSEIQRNLLLRSVLGLSRNGLNRNVTVSSTMSHNNTKQ